MSDSGSAPFIFVLLREGTSDEGLVAHIRTLLVHAGVPDAVGSARPYKGTIAERIEKVVEEGGRVDCIFVHRDSDARSPDDRYDEIRRGAQGADTQVPCVGVVPVREMESWLLVDESAIREVVGRAKGRKPLGIPGIRSIESTSDPKSVLKGALLVASEATGRRRDRIGKMFDRHRWLLLERLTVEGPVRQLSAWQRLEGDIATLVQGRP